MSEVAGRLRERVTLSRIAPTRDALGGAGGWETIGAAWAGFAPAGRGAAIVANREAGGARWAVTLRPRDIAVGDRILRGATLLRVTAVLRDPATPDRIVAQAEELA